MILNGLYELALFQPTAASDVQFLRKVAKLIYSSTFERSVGIAGALCCFARCSTFLTSLPVFCRNVHEPVAFKFTDSKCVWKLVNDMQGQYVLFHVWATWCGPYMNLKADVERFSKRPLKVVGLNIDDSPLHDEEIARKQELSWAQNYLGAKSDLLRPLVLSYVLEYYLIDPDGKLVGSSNA